MTETTNILIVGIGGQGVLKTSEVLSDVVLAAGYDVKQSEVHGMSQRGGSVVSEVRFGSDVHSPLTPWKGADYVIALDENEALRAEPRLRQGGRLLDVPPALVERLGDPRSRNMAALGRLSRYLPMPPERWHQAIERCLPPGTEAVNVAAFEAGRDYEAQQKEDAE